MSDPSSESASPALPDGFHPLVLGGEFMAVNGPLYLRLVDARVQMGFRVEKRHANPMDICHGGMMASFCDMLLPVAVHHQCAEVGRRFLPTINLQIDYLAPAPLGAWVQGEAEVLRATRSMVFVQGLVRADGMPVARASGIFKIGPSFGDDAPSG